MQGEKIYQEKLFVSFRLSQHVPADNFYRRLKSTLDLSFIREKTRRLYGSEGQKSIDPVVFFKLMLIGYIENLNSDRRIIEMASMRLDMLYFLDYDIDEKLPWHSTLSRTRKLYPEDLFIDLFSWVVHLCISKGLCKGSGQGVDSAPLGANASMDSLVRAETLAYLQELRREAVKEKELMKKAAATEEEKGKEDEKEAPFGSPMQKKRKKAK